MTRVNGRRRTRIGRRAVAAAAVAALALGAPAFAAAAMSGVLPATRGVAATSTHAAPPGDDWPWHLSSVEHVLLDDWPW